MTEKTRGLHFSVQGQLITRLARESVFYSKPPRIPYAINLLMSSLETDKLSTGDRLELAIKILNGEARIVGTYPGDDYGVELLDEKEGKYDLESVLDNMAKEIESLQAQNKELVDKLNCVAENVDDWRLRAINRNWRNDWGGDDNIFETDEQDFSRINDTVRIAQALAGNPNPSSDPISDMLDRMHSGTDNDYGWLSPTGEFYPEDFGGHQKWAFEYIKKTWPDEFKEQRAYLGSITKAGDYLVEKGWVLLHNPGLGTAFVTQSQTKPLTKAQREFLCDYYMERNKPDKARAYLEGNE